MAVKDAKKIIYFIFKNTNKSFNVEFWNKEIMSFGKKPEFTLVFSSKKSFKKIVRNRDVKTFAIEYINRRFDIKGDTISALDLKFELAEFKPNLSQIIKLINLYLRI